MDYQVVFDLGREGFGGWWVGFFGLLFFAIGAGLVRGSRDARPAMRRLAYFFMGFSVFWTALAVGVPYRSYLAARELLESGRTDVVEGVVESFVPMPYSGHALERFTVKGVRFAYSDYVIGGGFNRTQSHGGPIRQNIPVRINFNARHEILRLEIPKSEPYSPPPPGPLGLGPTMIPVLVPLIFLAVAALGWLWRWKQGTLAPAYNKEDLLFYESMVSGRSLKTWWTRIGGANNALNAALTKDALYIDLMMPFRLMPGLGLYDIEHRIPLHSLVRAEKKEKTGLLRWASRGVEALELEYRGATGETTVFVLYLSRRDELYDKLRELRPDLFKVG